MGTPIEPPGIEYTADCFWCTPGTFAPGKTPRFLSVIFSGIWKCLGDFKSEEMEPAFFVLENDPLELCIWRYEDAAVEIAWETSGDGVYYIPQVGMGYYEDTAINCDLDSTNEMECDPDGYEGGEAHCVPVNTPALLAYDYGFTPIPSPMHEFMGLVNSHQVHRFAHPNGKTCIYIKIDPDLLDT